MYIHVYTYSVCIYILCTCVNICIYVHVCSYIITQNVHTYIHGIYTDAYLRCMSGEVPMSVAVVEYFYHNATPQAQPTSAPRIKHTNYLLQVRILNIRITYYNATPQAQPTCVCEFITAVPITTSAPRGPLVPLEGP